MASRADSHRAEAGKRPCTKRARCADISVHFSIALPARRSNRAVRFPHHPAFLVRYTFCLSAVQYPLLCFFRFFRQAFLQKGRCSPRRSAPCQRQPTPRRPVQPGNARQKTPGGGCRSRHILVLTENAARTAAADQGCAASLPMTTRFSKI